MTATGDQNVVDLLLRQHEQIKALFNELTTAQGDRKRDLFQDLVRLLAVHESAEEELIHPLARTKIDHGNQVVEERLREESEAKRSLSYLSDLGVEHPQFDANLATLASAVVEHATHEEREEFPYLRENVSGDDLRRLASAVRLAEKGAPTRPHPDAGETATENVLVGPVLAVFDRARDAIRAARQ